MHPRVWFASWLIACAPTSPPPTTPPPPPRASPELRFDIGAIDRRTDPCEDFYQYACGTWIATHPIPAERSRWSRYNEVQAANLERTRSIVEAAARAGRAGSPAEQRIDADYASCMDEAELTRRGLEPVRPVLARIDAIKTSADVGPVIAELHAHGLSALFEAYAETDPHDAHRPLVFLDTGELGLPDQATYTSEEPAAVKLRASYTAYLTRLFEQAGAAPADAATRAGRTLAFETLLAQHALSAVDSRNLDQQDHSTALTELRDRYSAFDWPAYFRAIGAAKIDRVNVTQPRWLDAVQTATTANDLAGMRDYLAALVIGDLASMLTPAIEREVFEFRDRALRGTREQAPRWKRCLHLLDDDLGDDVGRLFLARYFPLATRTRISTMIERLRAAFGVALATSDWLGPAARAKAQIKLTNILAVIGGSNRLRTYEGLRVTRGDAFGNAWRARAFNAARAMTAIEKPTDREDFFESPPQQLAGFGSKTMNAVGFTAGFLQPPVFDPGIDDAVNYGGLGSVIGHELTHRFDDEGRKYDEAGNLAPWWSADDVARFEERAQCFVAEYDRFRLPDGTPLNGKLTLGENIADNGGIRLSYAALRPSETGPSIDGFTPAQRFFLAWGQIRCENVRPETARLLVATDPHAPGRWRVDGVVSNMPEFARAFGCKAGAPMAPLARCKVW